MSTISRSNFASLHERGIDAVYFNEIGLHDKGIIEKYFNMETSVKQQATEVVVAGVATALPISEGGTPEYDTIREAWSVEYLFAGWALALLFTHEAVADNLYLSLAKEGAKELGKAMAYTRQVQAHSFLNSSSVNIYSYGGSSYPLLSTSHPLVGGGTWANKRSSAALLSQQSLEDAMMAWTTEMVDLRGRKLMVEPQFLIHGSQDQFLVDRLLNSTSRPMSADNDVNPLRNSGLTPICDPHLSTDGRWFLAGPKGVHRMKHYDRERAGIKREDVQGTWGNKIVMTYQRNKSGATSPEAVWGHWT